MYRNEKPGPGRFRQFMQFDADTVGSASMAADAEVCMMIADTMEELGIPRGSYVVKVNNRKVLDGVMEAIGIGGEENAGKRLTVLRAIDKLDRVGSEDDVAAAARPRAEGRSPAISPRVPGCIRRERAGAILGSAASRRTPARKQPRRRRIRRRRR